MVDFLYYKSIFESTSWHAWPLGLVSLPKPVVLWTPTNDCLADQGYNNGRRTIWSCTWSRIAAGHPIYIDINLRRYIFFIRTKCSLSDAADFMQHALFHSWQHFSAYYPAFSYFLDFITFFVDTFSQPNGEKMAAFDWNCTRVWSPIKIYHAAFLYRFVSASFALQKNSQRNA